MGRRARHGEVAAQPADERRRRDGDEQWSLQIAARDGMREAAQKHQRPMPPPTAPHDPARAGAQVHFTLSPVPAPLGEGGAHSVQRPCEHPPSDGVAGLGALAGGGRSGVVEGIARLAGRERDAVEGAGPG